ncbi:uncharacterized protein LOC114527659 [Dendronephthya gigantea]|uniref:uncharacterized protein LOC114527659 n=1 Tax=Dendronephthya gigantea TaxID=151771 RepID=UPI00106C4026|nr:uncharacterized protein LOC114527659 [Dendronephthya gigantea]
MASIPSVSETPSQDKALNTVGRSREEKLLKTNETVEDGKALRKKIRHLRREHEKQAKSLTQDLKDIRETLSDVNSLNKLEMSGGNYGARRSNRNDRKGDDCYDRNSTKTERRREKSKGKEMEKPENIPSSSQRQKIVTLEDGNSCAGLEKKSDVKQSPSDVILSLSSIDLQ